MPESALILVDLQNDFLPGGALAVPAGDEVLSVANGLAAKFPLVVATQDWHPADHGSFASCHADHRPGDVVILDGLKQILWPDHCVQGTFGAEFSADLDSRLVHEVVRKGTSRLIDSYSGFFDNAHRQATGLDDVLREAGVRRVYVLGLATDYCVKLTALDARQLGYETVVVADGCRGVDLTPGDSRRAVEAMREAGVKIVDSSRMEQEEWCGKE